MDVRNDRGVVIAKISSGTISRVPEGIFGEVREGKVTDARGNLVGQLRKGEIIGADSTCKALYANNILSTSSGTFRYQFTGTVVLDREGFPILGLSENFNKYVDELVSYVVFFTELWLEHPSTMLYPYIHPGFY